MRISCQTPLSLTLRILALPNPIAGGGTSPCAQVGSSPSWQQESDTSLSASLTHTRDRHAGIRGALHLARGSLPTAPEFTPIHIRFPIPPRSTPEPRLLSAV